MRKSNQIVERKKYNTHLNKVLLTAVFVAAGLLVGFVLMSFYITKEARKGYFEILSLNTEVLSQNIQTDLLSEAEALKLTADVISNAPDNEEKSIRRILAAHNNSGLITRLELLTPAGKVITSDGGYSASGHLEFANEAELESGSLSAVSDDPLTANSRILRLSVPVLKNGKTIGVLYGVISKESFSKAYSGRFGLENKTEVYIIERASKKSIANFWLASQNPSETGEETSPQTDFSLTILPGEAYRGETDSVIASPNNGKTKFYVHYEPTGINDLTIVLASPAEDILSYSALSRKCIIVFITYFAIILLAYMLRAMRRNMSEDEESENVMYIQRLVFEAHKNPKNIQTALKTIGSMLKAEVVCFHDIEENRIKNNYIWKSEKCKLQENSTTDKARRSVLEYLSSTYRDKSGFLTPNSLKMNGESDLAAIMSRHNMNNIMFTVISNSHGETAGVMEAFNTKKGSSSVKHLEEVSISFSMAVNNMKYYERINIMWCYDSLTGLLNRNSYNESVAGYRVTILKNFGCVYLDVNGLHALNNLEGHEAGNKMLCSIANTVKHRFGEAHTYRIGGDEFVAFSENETYESLITKINEIDKETKENGYHVSVGYVWREKDCDVDGMIKLAEERMYEDKNSYYLEKNMQTSAKINSLDVEVTTIDKQDIESFLSVISYMYNGAFLVDLNTDDMKIIFISSYFSPIFSDGENKFSKSMQKYVADFVSGDYQRQFTAYLDYKTIASQLELGHIPVLVYEKLDGSRVRLKIFRTSNYSEDLRETVWLLEDVAGNVN